jgi:hypothetical protein
MQQTAGDSESDWDFMGASAKPGGNNTLYNHCIIINSVLGKQQTVVLEKTSVKGQ